MRLSEAFSSSVSIVAVLGAADGRFREVNDAFERITGYRRDQVIGRIPAEVGLWRDPEFRAQLWESLRAENRIVDTAAQVNCADGSLLAGRLHVELIQEDGEPLLFCLLQILPEGRVEALVDRKDSLFRALFLSASEGIYRSLPQGGFLDVNPAMARILGYESPAQLLIDLASDASRIYVDRGPSEEFYRRLRAEGHVEQFRLRVRRRDGRLIWVSENSRVVPNQQGQPAFYEGSMEDITAQVEAEEALRESQSLYRVLVENSRDGVFLIQRGKVVFANEAMAAILGYRQEELLGFDYMRLVAPEDLAAQSERKRRRESGSRELQDYRMRMLRKDGSVVICAVRADAVDYKGDIASTGTLRDVTEELQRQRDLVRAEHRYRELFEDSPAGLFRTALDGSIIEVNAMLARMLGYDDAPALRADIGNIMQIYADPALRNMLVERAARDGGFSGVEMQVRARSGALRWVSASVRTDYDHNGRPLSFTGSVLDIDEPQRMRQALQRSESRYRTLVEHSSVGVYLSSRSRLDYVNRALAAMLGYNESDLIGKHYLELLAPEVRDQTIHLHNRLRETGELQREHETVFLHSNGQRVYVRVNLLAIEIDGVRHTTGTILDITLQREAEARLRFHATRDPLTGLVNRMLFNSRLGEAIAGARASGDYRYAVLFLDLDGFKWVNDSLGHGAGDRLLVEIARRIENALIRECVIARYGGDEFTLLPEGPCDEARAVAIARQVIELFEAPFLINGQQVFSGCSVGIVHGRADYESPDQVLRDADTAMYRAKARGKAAYMVFDDAMHREARERFELETEFRQAFERGQFRVDFQPIVDLGSGRIVGAESLVRWRHPQRGLLLPGVFLPMAEETGLIAHLDTWVLGQAVQALLEWSRDGRLDDEFGLNVNVDERQLASSDIVDDLRAMLQAHPLPGARLRLEVTETVFRAGRAPIERRLSALKALGVGLIVDDFGTGYSSLESFAVSPFDALKIDQAFVRDLETNAKHRAIVRTIIGFAADLGLAVTAEGVETEAQRALLLEMGCRRGQGYLFAYPLPREEFEQLLQRKQLLAANG